MTALTASTPAAVLRAADVPSIRVDWYSASQADVYLCLDRYHAKRVGCVVLSEVGFSGHVHAGSRTGASTSAGADLDTAARDLIDTARLDSMLRGMDLDVRVGRAAPPDGMFTVPVQLRRLIEDGEEAFQNGGVSQNGRGWLTDAAMRIWTAQAKLRWLDGSGETSGQWGSRERVVSDVHYELMLAATYVLNAAAATDLNRKPTTEILQWAASVVSHGAHNPLGGDHLHSLRDRAGIAY